MSGPAGVERDVPMARLTTVGTGGPARWFARPETAEALAAVLRWAGEERLPVAAVGLGSNLLAADTGFDGLVVRLAGDLARVERDGERIVCGGGAALAVVVRRSQEWGLAGIEFGCAIPGTVGGAVRMNANAYGGQLAKVLEWVDVVDRSGTRRREPGELGFEYRRSNLRPDEVVARASFGLEAASSEDVKATLADMRARRKAAQPSGIKTFGSTFKNPDDPRAEGRTAGRLLEEAGCRGLRIGGASFSSKHANFIVNHGDATTADVIAVMAEGRRRVYERFGVKLEAEVQALGPVELPADWADGE
jgi:UDP-N-acetylenolpyruvoylglucosamine reductase